MAAVRERRRSGWKVALLTIVVAVLVAGAAIGGIVGLRSTAQPAVAAPASVIGWDPGVTRGVPLTAPISVYFNRPMDHAAVQKAWALSPTVKGSFSWSGTSVTFRPSSPLAPESVYRLHIGKAALDDQRRRLHRPFAISFATGNVLEVESETPAAGTTEVPVSSPITLTFNHPMVALAGLGAAVKDPPGWRVTIGPRTPGSGTWLGTSTWVFHPASGLLPSSTYTVTVSGAAQDAWGMSLGSPVSWTFSTVRPAVIAESPSRGSSSADPSAPVSVTFNQPMDAATTALAFSLNDGDGVVPGSTAWNGDTLQFQPSMALDPDRSYTATVSRAAVSATGGIGLDTPVSWTFRVAPPPRVLSSMPSSGATAAQSFVQIHFSAPMNVASLDRALTVTPALSGMSTYGTGNSYGINGDFQPSTAYTVSLAPGSQDQYGRTMQNGYTLRFTTAPLPPAVTLYGAAGAGPGVTLSSGRVGQAPVQVMNVPSVHYTLMRTTLAAVLRYQYGTRPTIPAGATIHSWTVSTPHPLNRVQNLHAELANADGSALSPGVYWLGARGPGSGSATPASSELVAVGDAGVTMKVSQHRVLVWITSAQSGQPLSGEQVQLVDYRGKAIASGTTDAQGLHEFKVANSYAVQAATATGSAFGMAMSDWLPAAQSQAAAANPLLYTADSAGQYLYTDRPIYRPGQTVHFRAIVWRYRAGVYSTPGHASVSVAATDGAGRNVYRKSLGLDRFGTVHGSFALPSGAGTGYGSIFVSFPHAASQAASTNFVIAAYRKPEFLTSVTAPLPSYTQGQTINATVRVSYVFGAPAAGQQVDWTAFSNGRPALPQGWEKYQFSDESALEQWYAAHPFVLAGEGFFGQEIAHGSGTTDGTGRLSVQVPVDLTKDPMDQTITIEATGTDINHQPVSGRLQVVALKAGEQIGLAPRENVVASGSTDTVDVAVVSPGGAPIANAGLTGTVYRRTYTSELGGSTVSGSLWRQVPHDTQVSSQTFSTGSGGKAHFSFTADRGGEYYVVVTGQDSLGNVARSGVLVYASGAGYSDLGVSDDTSLAVQPDRRSYMVGQTARIQVAAPFAGGTALVTTERSGILSYRVERLVGAAVRVPITAADIPNIYVSVTLYRGRIGASPPAWRYGVAELHVSVAPRRLVIHLSQDRARYLPGQRATYTVTTTDPSGRPVPAEVSLSLVDTAVLALHPDPNPDILSALYGERPLGVTTASDGAVSIDGLQQSATSRVQPGGAGGGGGGGAEPATVYRRFRDTGYWQADLVTGRSGRATVRVTLPDNFTTWRLLARGVTAGFRVGQATLRTLSTRDVVLRPVVPRFFLQGDRLRVGVVVNNDTSRPARLRVSVRASGISISGSKRTIVIPGGGERLARWKAAVPGSQRATLTFAEAPAAGSRSGYSVQVRVPVHPPLTEEVVATAGQVFGSTKQEVVVPPDAASRPGDLTIQLSSSLTAGLGHAYAAFAPSRYESNDDIAARLTAAAALRGMPGSGVSRAAVAGAAATLERRQRSDGGWPWFSGTNATTDPLVTSDVVMALSASGHASSLRRARGYLVSQLGAVTPDERAALLLAIARTGAPDTSATQALFRDSVVLAQLSPGGLADLARALALSGEHVAARSLDSRLDSTAVVSATGANWEAGGLGGGTAVEETARALSALVSLTPTDAYVAAAARWLVLERSGTAWDTTRDSALAASALTSYARRAHEAHASYRYEVAVDGRTLLRHTVSPRSSSAETVRRPVAALRRSGASFDISRVQRAGSVGGGPLYYLAQLHYFLRAGTIPPISQGIGLRRRYLDFAGHAVTAARAGTTLQVELTLQTGRTLTHLALDDPIPAGFEPIDQSLNTSRQGLFKAWQPVEPSPGIRDLSLHLTHTDLRDDRVSLYAESLPPGTYRFTYLVQATNAGSYGVAPARASETFFPDVFGRSAGQVVTVR